MPCGALREAVDVLLDPRTGTAVTLGENGVLRGGSGRDLPRLGSIPCLLQDDGLFAFWAQGLAAYRDMAAATDGNLAQVMARAALPATRARVQRMRQAWQVNAAAVLDVFRKAGLTPGALPAGGQDGGPELPAWVMDGYTLLMRDWSWGDTGAAENTRALDHVRAVMGDLKSVRRLLSLGAGGGRLTWDVHRLLGPELTVAIDINPFPLLVAERLMGGEAITLWDFPTVPARPEDAATEHLLACPQPTDERLLFLIADARTAPIRPGSMDAVLTHWYIDQVVQDLPSVVAGVHALLPKGGVWLNLGPLIYPAGFPFDLRYTMVEVRALLERAGFAVQAVETRRTHHLEAPGSASARIEDVHAFLARKL